MNPNRGSACDLGHKLLLNLRQALACRFGSNLALLVAHPKTRISFADYSLIFKTKASVAGLRRSTKRPEHIKIGAKILNTIDEAIRLLDRVVLVLSEASSSSEWVTKAFAEDGVGGLPSCFRSA